MITLPEAKQHLRVMHDLDDGLIESAIVAAMAYVTTQVDDMPDPMPAPIKAAVLLLVADLYENRSRQEVATGQGGFQENSAFRLLLSPYRSMQVLA